MQDILFSALFLFPLLGFFINGFRFKSTNTKIAGLVGSLAVGLSFLSTAILFYLMLQEQGHILRLDLFTWIEVGKLKANFSFLMDPISGLMSLVITGVGSLIHLFSIGYMEGDERPAKYFSYLNLFIFNMLLLVLGSNLLITFIGWEGVGLCSYLLIGFWFSDEQKASAGRKAFITNRIGDVGLLLGIFVIFAIFQSINYEEITHYSTSLLAENSWTGAVTLSMLFIFLGVTGKSAQIPLYVWLPDAMAGPTPVSALIHAATMVTAGVYLLIRLSSLLLLAPNAMMLIASVGALTALLAATIALTQWDIKKILAYSTVSQLGYMIMAVGVGAFIPALFHLITHAFFKALMFLASGSIIHAMHHEQDIRKMGRLKKYMPITHLAFLVGWLAIIGLPPFSGFFSKDEILWWSFASTKGSGLLWALGFLAAICTSFYMTRLMYFVFWKKESFSTDHAPIESPKTMTIPLILLAVLAAMAGLLGIPHIFSEILPGHPPNYLELLTKNFVVKVNLNHLGLWVEWGLLCLSVLVAIFIPALTAYTYFVKENKLKHFLQKIKPLHLLVENKYYVDEIYEQKLIQPFKKVSQALWEYIDVMFIDKVTYWASDTIKQGGKYYQIIQNGKFQTYALMLILGIVTWFVFILML